HAVPERRDEGHVRLAVERGELALVEGAEEIADRDPVRVAVAPVDVPDELLDLASLLDVVGDERARGRRDLDEADLVRPARVALEEPREAAEALGNPLRVVEAVDAEDDLPPADRLAELLAATLGAARARPGDVWLGVDADRVDADPLLAE